MTRKPGFGFFIYFVATLLLGGYFAYAAVRGDLGVLERVSFNAELRELEQHKQVLESEVQTLTNKTKRLSDSYLDLDLLDERARTVLGLMRADDLAIR